MTKTVSESAFESTIEAGLARGGFQARPPESYDRKLCLIPQDLLAFVIATQPEMWKRYQEHYGAEAKTSFLDRVSREITDRGTLDVLRKGVRDSGRAFHLAYFRPHSGLNDDLKRLYLANAFTIVRQLKFNPETEQSLDLGIFLNGIPLFTAELKNPLNGQTVEDAIKQYRFDRDPRQALFRYRRCLGHFAVDPDLVFVTTELHGPGTRFLPFNKGWAEGAGNPPVKVGEGFATSYLWEEIWSRDSLLDLIQQFVHEVDVDDPDGRPTGKKRLLFPRFHQLDAVRRMVEHARENGTGQRYLVQHSAGSGKSNTIAWLAHRLSVLHDTADARVFDSIIVVTDRKVLDRQLQKTVYSFEQTTGVVEKIDIDSKQLKTALEQGKTIIISTLQKFPVIAGQIGALPGKRFAVIVDEAHSSQSGETSRSLKTVLSVDGLAAAAAEEEKAQTPEEEIEERILEEIRSRGRLENVSWFAFTATPKAKTLELFGQRQADGTYRPFSLYSMKQAIEEGFILNVLQNYTTYKAYWRLLKKIAEDPKYEKDKAEYLLKQFVELHPHAIDQKVRIMLAHFEESVADRIKGQAKAMVVTRSRLHAVRYKLAFDKALAGRGASWKALVAFSDTVRDGGKDYTETNMNGGLPEKQTALTFRLPEYRFLIVAQKFQTGFDEPLLHTMYVDKRLSGVNTVQTLSRLNRTFPDKEDTSVLDFANDVDEVIGDFEPYYRTTILSEGTDPNILYERQNRALNFGIFGPAEVKALGKVYFGRNPTQDKFYAILNPIVERFKKLPRNEQDDLRSILTDFVRLYSFLSQIISFADPDLEKFYQFSRLLRRLIPSERESLPREIQEKIDMESFRLDRTFSGSGKLEGKGGRLDPKMGSGVHGPVEDEEELLSRIIRELNERFGLNLGEDDKVTIRKVMDDLDRDRSLDAVARINPREKARLAFDQKLEGRIAEIVDNNVALYRRITEDAAFGDAIKNLLFDSFMRTHRQADQLLKQMESQTLEFKSTLRWDLKNNVKDEIGVTHAALKTIAAFLNTEGGDLLLGVADDRSIVGIDKDGFESEDKFALHLMNCIKNGMGTLAGTCVDPNIQVVGGKAICVVSCRRSPEPVWLSWRTWDKNRKNALPAEPRFYVRSGPRTDLLSEEDAEKYIAQRWGDKSRSNHSPVTATSGGAG